MRIGVDVDGVLCDFRAGVRRLLAQQGWTDAQMPDCGDWDFYLRWDVSERSFEQIVARGEAFALGPPISGARRAVGLLRSAGYEIHLVTARPEHVREITEDWLVDHKFGFDSLNFTADKHVHELDVYLDDKPAQIEALRAEGCRAVVFDQPWNQKVEGPRMHGWDDVGALLRTPRRVAA